MGRAEDPTVPADVAASSAASVLPRGLVRAASDVVAKTADPLLVERVRHGDVDASLVLWRRHADLARALAVRHSATAHDHGAHGARLEGADADEVEDLVNRTFARMLREIASDQDPVAPFLLYLYGTLRLEAGDGRGPSTAEPAVLRAFRRLRGSYQTVLWYSQVEPVAPETLGIVLGRDPDELVLGLNNATSRLRSEWIAEIVADPTTPDTCAWLTLRVDAYDATMLSELAEQRYIRHINRCETCPKTVVDLDRFPEILGTTVRGLIAGLTSTGPAAARAPVRAVAHPTAGLRPGLAPGRAASAAAGPRTRARGGLEPH